MPSLSSLRFGLSERGGGKGGLDVLGCTLTAGRRKKIKEYCVIKFVRGRKEGGGVREGGRKRNSD